MPAWGFYPNGSAYGGTPPLDGYAAWTAGGGKHLLTWVADFPAQASYQVWVRKYGGYGDVAVSVDEEPVTGGKGGPGGGRYVWVHLGTSAVAKGSHHVDVTVTNGMLDAVLFTLNPNFDPEKEKLPEPVKDPLLRALRTYRDDSGLKAMAGKRGFVVGSVVPYEELLHDYVPTPERVLQRLRLWGAANQYITGSFALRFLEAAAEFKASLKELSGPGTAKVKASDVDLRVVQVRERKLCLFEGESPKTLVPELLVRDDRTGTPPKGKQGGFGGGVCFTRVPSHQSRQFWLTVHVPQGHAPGIYQGTILLEVTGVPARKLSLPVEVEVLPIDLRPAEGYYSIYYPSQPVDPKQPNYVTSQRYLAELKDQVRHGLNTATLYGGEPTLHLAQQAGMTEAPCIMHWPDSTAPADVGKAKTMGFADLYYYGVDEPNTPEAIERCRKEAERRLAAGLHMMTAINSAAAQVATKDCIDRPVYNIYVFGGKDNAAAMYVRSKGFKPISYWTTAPHFPLNCRALTGLYNKLCGYLGSAPWAYQDVPGNELYAADKVLHAVSYPDEFGEPIPTQRWEAHREGINDVRYLEALDRALAAAQERLHKPSPPAGLAEALAKAREVRKSCYEGLESRWFAYLCSLQPGTLEAARHDIAEAIVAINKHL